MSTATTSIRASGTIETHTDLADLTRALGTFLTRYGLVVVFVWIGAMKFTAYEANAIQPLVANSPFMSWWPMVSGVSLWGMWILA